LQQTSPKALFFIRHGQSEANFNKERAKSLQLYRDSPLTDRGRSEGENLSFHPSLKNVELVLSSPLSRALQTACLAFPTNTILALPYLTEISHSKQNDGRNVEELILEFPQVDYSRVGKNWWKDRSDLKTVTLNLISFLLSRQEKCIAIFSHSRLIQLLLGTGRSSVFNAQVWEATLSENGQSITCLGSRPSEYDSFPQMNYNFENNNQFF